MCEGPDSEYWDVNKFTKEANISCSLGGRTKDECGICPHKHMSTQCLMSVDGVLGPTPKAGSRERSRWVSWGRKFKHSLCAPQGVMDRSGSGSLPAQAVGLTNE